MIALAIALSALIALILASLWIIPKWLEAREDSRKLRAADRIRPPGTASSTASPPRHRASSSGSGPTGTEQVRRRGSEARRRLDQRGPNPS